MKVRHAVIIAVIWALAFFGAVTLVRCEDDPTLPPDLRFISVKGGLSYSLDESEIEEVSGKDGQALTIFYCKVNARVTYSNGRDPWLATIGEFHGEKEDEVMLSAFKFGQAWVARVKEALRGTSTKVLRR